MTEQIKQNPNDASLYLKRGELHRDHRDWSAALADYDVAIKLDPERIEVELARGKMMFDAGWFEGRILFLARLVREKGQLRPFPCFKTNIKRWNLSLPVTAKN